MRRLTMTKRRTRKMVVMMMAQTLTLDLRRTKRKRRPLHRPREVVAGLLQTERPNLDSRTKMMRTRKMAAMMKMVQTLTLDLKKTTRKRRPPHRPREVVAGLLQTERPNLDMLTEMTTLTMVAESPKAHLGRSRRRTRIRAIHRTSIL